MKSSEALAKFDATLEYINRPQTSFRSGGFPQPYPEQCPVMVNGELLVSKEDGSLAEMNFVKGRTDRKSNLEIVFLADGWYWTWSENNSEDGWSSEEDEPSDEPCQFLGEWEKEESE